MKYIFSLPEKLSPSRLFYFLIFSLVLVSATGALIFIVSFIATLFDEFVHNSSLCFSSGCVSEFSEHFGGSFLILAAAGSLLTFIATCGGIIVALLNYLQNVEASTQSNSIAHMNLFLAQAKQEVAIRERLSIRSFDLLAWYNIAFKDANSGRKLISDEYVSLIKSLNDEIDYTNRERTAGNRRVDFIDHQVRLRRALQPLGIQIASHPKSDFLVVEDQIFDLLTAINQSFCRERYADIQLYARDYR